MVRCIRSGFLKGLICCALVYGGVSLALSLQVREHVRVEAAPLDEVEFSFVVQDRTGRPVQGLGKSDFTLRVDGRRMAIDDFAEERLRVDRPLSIAFLLDVSGSMRGLERKRFLLASKALLDRLRPSDEMILMTFAGTIAFQGEFTHDPTTLMDAFESAPLPSGGTDLEGALEEAFDRLSGRPARRVVILYSDGEAPVDRNSFTTTPDSLDVLDSTRRQPVPVYWIVPHFQGIQAVESNPGLLGLVRDSGGRWILETRGIEKAFDGIGEDLISQYSASFSVDKKDHRHHSYRIDLSSNVPGLTVRAPHVASGSGSLVRRLSKMLSSDDREERIAAARQLTGYGYARAFPSLLRAYHRETDAEAREVILSGLLAVLREEWNALGGDGSKDGDSRRRGIEHQLRKLESPRAASLLEEFRSEKQRP